MQIYGICNGRNARARVRGFLALAWLLALLGAGLASAAAPPPQSAGRAGEYSFTMFAVVTSALIVSWIVAVFTPYVRYAVPDLVQQLRAGRD